MLRTNQQRQLGIPALETRMGHGSLVQAVATEVVAAPYDLILLAGEPARTSGLLQQVLDDGQQHILLLPPQRASVPTRALVSLAGIEASKTDVDFAGRLLRHLGIEATLLTVLDDQAEDGARADPERAQRFLDASVRSLALLGVRSEPATRTGDLLQTIHEEMTSGRHDLLVLGAPVRPLSTARIRPLLTGTADYPILIVRSPYSASSAHARVSVASTVERGFS
jgi:nucleotide-binding universal stress UspA family protein